jgi:tRNA dimethylallyltransferase
MISTELPFSLAEYQNHKPLIVILGPTACGKTELAIQVAAQLHSEIISADSRLFYLGMDIGTAKPTRVERSHIPHHLIDVTTPDKIWSLAEFQHAVHGVIDSLHKRGSHPILAGGTGQYIHSITQGWQIPPAQPNQALRQALEQWAAQIGYLALHNRLAVIDPIAASSIDPSNVRRTIRALEVIMSSGYLFSTQKSRRKSPYEILQIGILRPRAELYQRIDTRIQEMIDSGFAAEVQHLLDQGYLPSLPTMSAIGYGEMVAYIQGEISLVEAVTRMKHRTRIFVRRQANWFKENDPSIRWFPASPDLFLQVEQAIHTWLSSLKNTNPVSK